ncbi:Aste57867_24062 [Aphanomyces stellatus]|uniref:Aste57867_24062 protein n=1 Tax=Aphanomyces stellatus TaxID=120398 RepID=A0A485LPE5_9STRA|nr:hypothetical protein As57867_023989 [Aphanomyces stellatus]VFU00705.1 Aste57867_24062 [Aphanomyces stellatus]
MSVAPFIQSLLDMLASDAPCLRWSPDDRNAFDILDTKEFADSVLPQYFRHAKFTSFQRQLNYFGFRKQSRRHSSICTYAHAQFSMRVHGDAIRIKRKVIKPKTTSVAAPSVDSSATAGTGGVTPSTATVKNSAKTVLAYTEASLAYAQVWSRSVSNNEMFDGPKWTDMDMMPLPFERGDDGGDAPTCHPFDDELASWVLSQF